MQQGTRDDDKLFQLLQFVQAEEQKRAEQEFQERLEKVRKETLLELIIRILLQTLMMLGKIAIFAISLLIQGAGMVFSKLGIFLSKTGKYLMNLIKKH